MGVRDSPDFDTKMSKLKHLLNLREEPRTEIDQKYLAIESVIDRVDALIESKLLEDHRVLTIGDADLTGMAIAIFGNPSELVVADIDDRLSEIYFEATLDYDLPVRYLYHDMRIKIIAILKRQYSLVLCEPPRTKSAISLFLSRALEILEPGDNNKLIFSIPEADDKLLSHFISEIDSYGIKIVKKSENINSYLEEYSPSTAYELSVPNDVVPRLKDHFLDPLYEREVNQTHYEYKCHCDKIYQIGADGDFSTKEELESNGCSNCNYKGKFVFNTAIKLH